MKDCTVLMCGIKDDVPYKCHGDKDYELVIKLCANISYFFISLFFILRKI